MPKANYGFKGTAITLADAVAAGAAIPASQYQYYSQLSAISPLLPPGRPSGLTVTGGTNQVTVSWTAPSGSGSNAATGYKVSYVNDSGTAVTATTSSTSTTITGLSSGSTYSFSVVAYNVNGDGDPESVSGSPLSFSTTAVMLTSGTSYTVPSGANSMKIWAVGAGGSSSAWNGGGGGTAYRTFSCTPGTTISYSLNDDTVVTYDSISMRAYAGGSSTGSFGSLSNSVCNGGVFGGAADGGAQGGRSRTQPLGMPAYSSGAVGQGGSGLDEWHSNSVETGSILSCGRIPAADVSDLFAALALAGVNTTESCGSTAAFGSGGYQYKYGTPKSFGIGGGGHVGAGYGNPSGAVVIKFMGGTVSNPQPSYTPSAVLLTSGAQSSSLYNFNGNASEFQKYTVPTGATKVKAWAVGGGAFPYAGGVAYAEWSVFSGQSIYYRVGASRESSYVCAFGSRFLIGHCGQNRAQGTGDYSGGDGGARGGQGTQYGGYDWGGSIGGNGSAQYVGGTYRTRKAPIDVSGLLAAVTLAGGPSDFGYGDYTEKYYSLPPGIGGGARWGDGGQGCVVLYFT